MPSISGFPRLMAKSSTGLVSFRSWSDRESFDDTASATVIRIPGSSTFSAVNPDTKSVSKASGALEVKKILGADKIIAFGDNLNDIPLFEIADECYAVSNAEDELKKIATDVIASNDEDAVAEFIQEYLKKNN